MRKTVSTFLKRLQLATACGLIAGSPLSPATTSAATLQQHASTSSPYVALGDSYASGEGLLNSATTYLSPSNSDGCHRSGDAYPVLVAANVNVDLAQFETYGSGGFAACSGATTKDLLRGENGEPAQVSALSSATRWVTVSDGGDDLHFSNVLLGCLDLRASAVVRGRTRSYTQSGVVHESQTCDQYLASANALFATSNGASKELVTLEHLYKQIFVHAPTAEVAVLTYPQLFTQSPPAFCPVASSISLSSLFKLKSAQLNVGYSASRISEFNQVETELNTAISSAVSAVSALGDNIHLVDVNSLTTSSAIPCNLATTASSDMNAFQFSPTSPLATIVQDCHFDLAHLLLLRPFVTCPSNEAALFARHVIASKSFHPKLSAHQTARTPLSGPVPIRVVVDVVVPTAP